MRWFLKTRSVLCIWTLLVLTQLPVFAVDPSASVNLSEQELAKVRQGQVVIQPQNRTSKGKQGVLAKVLIERSPQQVWNVILDQEQVFQGDPYMKQVQLLKALPQNQQLVEYTLALSKLLPTFRYTLQVENHPQEKISRFKRVSGSFKDLEGFTQLIPMDNGQKTLMVYSFQVEPGFFAPKALFKHFTQVQIPQILKRTQQLVYTRYPQ